MKLEIIKDKKPLTCFDAEEAVKFIGKECFFSDDLDNFDYLDDFNDKLVVDGYLTNMYKGKLLGIFANDAKFIVDETDISSRFNYCLPCEWVQEKKKAKKNYRPFTISEFIQKYSVGELFKIREKQNRFTVSELQYVGHKVYEPRIYLGITDFTLDELFENFEMCINDDCWIPFGTKE